MDEDLLKSDLVEIAWQDISGKAPHPNDRHFHKKSVEINIVISGWVKAKINGISHKIEKGEFYILYPGTLIESIKAGSNTQLIAVRAQSLPYDKFSDN